MAESFARELYRHRQRSGLSLRRLGAELGVSFSTLARIERGEGQPDPHTRHLLEHWMRPDQQDTTTGCPRCMQTPREERLQSLEKRIVMIEAQIQSLTAGLQRALRVTSMHEPIGPLR